jgi:hypothetical protein
MSVLSKNPQGRNAPQKNAVKGLFEYRRAIAVTQVLALGDDRAVYQLAEAWGLPREPNVTVMTSRLAQYALDHARAESEGAS